jgi:oligosaccharide reducing-end xylanase
LFSYVNIKLTGKKHKRGVTKMKKFFLMLCFILICSAECTALAQGAVGTGVYRNLFAEIGKNKTEIDQKVNDAFLSLFHGDQDAKVYYEFNDREAYIKDIGSNDIRTEGMSYGMMICVQLDKKEEFDKLWNFAKNRMQNISGKNKGYFKWHVTDKGEELDNGPASDGEEYFVTALMFADKRWGSNNGIDYISEANNILNTMLHKEDYDPEGSNMFNTKLAMVKFVPGSTFTDPSYHLPAFYEIWAKKAARDNEFWSKAASASRKYFKVCSNPSTGLVPDYAEYDGSPVVTGGHENFSFDAIRTIQNAAVDYAWWKSDPFEAAFADRIQAFFESKGLDKYECVWTLDGKKAIQPYHTTALISMNAVASLSATDKARSKRFVEELWKLKAPTGQWRYYDGMLYMLAMLHCSGNFKAYI